MERPEVGQELYVIVCTDLHTAYGPIVGMNLAIDMARSLTKASTTECVFAPVPMVPLHDQVKAIFGVSRGMLDEKTEIKTVRESGGYL